MIQVAMIKRSYTEHAIKLLSKESLCPNEGSKIDPAHPAIYPTGEKPKGKLEVGEIKLFDLILKRFLATFGESAIIQHTTISILVKDDYIFKTERKKVSYKGWISFYKPYASTSQFGSQIAFPILYKNDILNNVDITLTDKFTPPPARFNQSSLLEEMEKKKIGNKATRSEIINTFFKRNYITNTITTSRKKENNAVVSKTGIEPTDIGFEIIQSMRKHIPNIVSVDLTRSMEEQLEEIELGRVKSEFVIDGAKNKLKDAIIVFKENQKDIGNKITNAVVITKNKQQNILGPCPICNKGDLIVKKSSRTKKKIVGCSFYSSPDKCTATAPLPQNGTIKGTNKQCPECPWPIIQSTYYRQGKKHRWNFCLNMQCLSKNNNNKDFQNK